MTQEFFNRHKPTLDAALAALATRGCWSAFPEIPSGKVYGESAKDDGAAAFQKRLSATFSLDQPGSAGTVGSETSPYGLDLGIQYPRPDLDALLAAAQRAIPAWREAGVEARVGVCIEILTRLNRRSFELANAVMHTTGQAFMMAFQAGGPHAQDRGLEAVAIAFQEMTRTPPAARWEKQVGKSEVVRLDKRYRIVPRGVAVVVSCSTFPTWNSYPALFASLATGNAVVVKPHPGSVLPLAITVETARQTLREAGFDPNLVTLAADSHDAPITRELVTRPEIGIVDYTGNSAFGEWIEQNARHAVVFTEKAGVNSTVVDSFAAANLQSFAANLAFSLSLYSGQMCTTPQNIFIPAAGVRVGDETVPFDAVAAAIVSAIDGLLGDPKRAVEVLGAIQNEATLRRIDQAAGEGAKVLRASASIAHETLPNARIRSPLILRVAAADRKRWQREMFGPIVYLVETEGTKQSIELAAETARTLGSITCGVYSANEDVLREAEDALTLAGAPVSCNLTGSIWVNQAAAFSDLHVSGANPSGNATLCDAAFVAPRFRVVQSRRAASKS